MSELPHISQAYTDRLSQDYGSVVAETIRNDWRYADLTLQAGESMAYVRLGQEKAEPTRRRVLFVPGYTGGIVANAPFAAAMAHRKFDIILPDQNRSGMLRNPSDRKDATFTQAMGLAALIGTESLQDVPLDVVTHSYGSLIFDELSKYAKHAGWKCFEGAKVAMLAPAGIKHDERPLAFMQRYIAVLRMKEEKFPDSYHEFEEEMLRAGLEFLRANKRKDLREGWEIISRRVNISGLLVRHIARIALVPFAADPLYSGDVLEGSLKNLNSNNIVSFTPVFYDSDDKGLRSGRGAGHADQQFNPERVAGSIAQFLKN